ncbi:MAG: alpha/beta fold hydrolase [Baekduia sp.]
MSRAPRTTTAAQLRGVEEAFQTLPDRYLGAPPGYDVTFHVRLGDLGHTFEVRATERTVRVRKGISRRPADVVLGTDIATWLALRDGSISGIEAFLERRLYARGDLDDALRFESLFALPDGRDPHLQLRHAGPRGRRLSVASLGEGPDVVLIHGLGATKSSFLDAAAMLANSGHRVHALDLPGFGGSDKPLLAPFDAPWFARTVWDTLDELGLTGVHLVGNSLGGRVSIEMALARPQRVRSITGLCPAVAFVKRDFRHVVRVLRPEFGLLPHRFTRKAVDAQLRDLFCDLGALDPSMADIVVDEFQRIYTSPGARLAFLSAARNIYLDRPYGRGGFYERLAELEPPSLFVWATHDRLIPQAFRSHVERALPAAEHVVLDACGHTPQVERPEETAAMVAAHIARAEKTHPARTDPLTLVA